MADNHKNQPNYKEILHNQILTPIGLQISVKKSRHDVLHDGA
jgi:hypothetical protein